MEEWEYAFDPDKNAWLIRERGISFEQIIALIGNGSLIQVLEHHDRERYPTQLLYEVDVDGYIYVVPVVREHRTLFFTRIIHDGSWRNRAVAWRDGHVEPRGTEAYLKRYIEVARGEPARRRLVAAANPRLQQKRS